VTGAVTPAIAAVLIVVAVTGNNAVTAPESVAFVAVAPATVKKFSDTPDSVYPVFGVIVTVAVYMVADTNVE
jgi:hypothetical protein